ncbi:MAG: PTS sugar transporter subunit IIC [Fusobacterium sp. JB021]|nr:PTS sugar transporter subunit IIC [Fusobacterium sp. JB021]MDP0506888.1 PTS sugar transporter subunit IIC [Fusobacterium sp. JB019]
MVEIRAFLEKKDVKISVERYLIKAMSNMAMGLFASLLVGTILKTVGLKFGIEYLVKDVAPMAMQMTGAAIGVAVAYGLNAPPLVLFASTITGASGNALGGPACAFIATIVGVEIGKLISKETKIDVILTPAFTIISGMLIGTAIGPIISKVMWTFGEVIMRATELQPFYMGIFVSVLVGIALTLPISSAAICMMLSLGGIAAGAATVGCCSQMIGFAVISFRENGWGGFFAQGLGTSMLQMSNIIKNWKIWIPSILTSAILGPVATIVFKMENSPLGAGMGTSGLVGQVTTVSVMDKGPSIYVIILFLHFILPGVISLIIAEFMRKKNWIKEGDLRLHL